MKCNSCGSEWNANPNYSITKCPFCGMDIALPEESKEPEAAGIIKEIINKHGINILEQKDNFNRLFRDYAPKLVHENRILQLALDENIIKYFLNCNESDCEKNLEKAKQKLIEVLNPIIVKEILDIFISVFNLNVSIPEINLNIISEKNQTITIKHHNEPESRVGTYTGPTVLKALPHGVGKAVYDDGDVYEGEWEDGRFNGKGKLTYSDGGVYEGEWKDGSFNGKGKLTYPNGVVYEGEFKNGNFDGEGKLTFSDGKVYEGEFEYNYINGKGKLTFPDGGVYEGEFDHAHRNGEGKETNPDGSIYEGEWKYDERHGKGKETFSNGTVYEGEFKDDEFNGKGKITYPDDTVYKGEFKDSQYNGKGKITFDDGETLKGYYYNGELIKEI